MNHLDITPHLRDQKRNSLQRKAKGPLWGFLGFLAALFLVFSLFYFDIIEPKFKSPEESLAQAVSIITTTSGSQGTAFLVSENYLLTARHVVSDISIGDKVFLDFVRAGVSAEAVLEWMHTSSNDSGSGLDLFLLDFALLKLITPDAVRKIEPLVLGNSDGVPVLSKVIVSGFPNGDFSMTAGSINSDNIEGRDLFKIDAASNAGNSGGPLILEDDKTVIGILVGGRIDETYSDLEGENVANKINNVIEILGKNGFVL